MSGTLRVELGLQLRRCKKIISFLGFQKISFDHYLTLLMNLYFVYFGPLLLLYVTIVLAVVNLCTTIFLLVFLFVCFLIFVGATGGDGELSSF